MSKPDRQLFYNLLLFGRLLRGLGLDVDSGRMIDLVQALNTIDIRKRDDFYQTLRCSLVHRREDFQLFDLAFDLFWQRHEDGRMGMEVRTQGEIRKAHKPPVIIAPPLHGQDRGQKPRQNGQNSKQDEPPIIQATFTYSDQEVIRHKNFADLTPEELDAIRHLITNLAWQLGERRSRRSRPGKGMAYDLRRTLRNNLSYGGDVLEWSRREAKYKPRPLVVIADISGSMERYTRLLLHFAYSLNKGFEQGVETFVFSTQLTRVTRLLRGRDVDRVLAQISQAVPDWSGGTRIGEALKAFNCDWTRRVLGHGAVVLLISDGWDCGDVGLLHEEIARLQRSSYRLIWLNPLLGDQGYKPLTQGMQTALPFIDDFLPVHNLASLEDLARHLQRIDESRPTRRQVIGSNTGVQDERDHTFS